MKLRYSFLLLLSWLLGVGRPAISQTITNATFETWAVRNTIEAPTSWQTTDDVLHALLVQLSGAQPYYNTSTVTKSTDVHGGTYAASLKTLVLTGVAPAPLPGILILGTKPGVNGLGGLPYTSRPAQFQFYYKLTGPVADSAIAVLYLTGTAAGQPTLIGRAQQYLKPTSGGYVGLSLPIQYTSSATPDSVRIQFSSGAADALTPNTTLLVDDVSLSNKALAVRADASIQARLSVGPNPSPAGRFQLSAPDEPALASGPYTVLDALGRQVAHQPALAVPSATRELDFSSFATGIYLLRLDTKQGTIVRQLVIK
jgi:hypothetical protein